MTIEIEGKTLLCVALLATLLYYSEQNYTVATVLRIFVLAYVLYKIAVIVLFLVNKAITIARNEVNLRRLKTDPRRTDIPIDEGYQGIFRTERYILAYDDIVSMFKAAEKARVKESEFAYTCEVEKLVNSFILARLSIPLAAYGMDGYKELLEGTITAFKDCGYEYPEVSERVIAGIRRYDEQK